MHNWTKAIYFESTLKNQLPAQTMDAELDMSTLMGRQLTTFYPGTEKMWQAPASTHYTHSFFQPDKKQLRKWIKN